MSQANLSSAKKELLQRRLAGRGKVPIPSRDPAAEVPLSFAQQRFWLFNQIQADRSNAYYQRPLLLRLQGELDPDALCSALTALVERQSILRTRFPLTSGGPIQEILPPSLVCPTVYDLSSLAPPAQAERLAAILSEIQRPFDLLEAPPLRWALVKQAAEDAVLIAAMHHIIFDGWSSSVFQTDLAEFYAAAIENRPPRLPPLSIDYADYACWQRASPSSQESQRQLAAWKEQLAGSSADLDLPYERKLAAVPRTETESIQLCAGQSKALREMAANSGCTLFMLLLSAYYTLLHRWTGQTDCVVGAPVSGRSRPEFEPLIGVFINPLPLRCRLEPEMPFSALLERVKQVCLDAFSRQETPFEQIVEALSPPRAASQPPLFHTLFQLRNLPRPILGMGELRLEEIKLPSLTEYDLSVEAAPDGESLSIHFHYNPERLNQGSARSLAEGMAEILVTVLSAPQTSLEQLPILNPAARAQLLALSRPAGDIPTVPDLLEHLAAQTARRPEHGVVLEAGRLITCQELNAETARVAGLLTQAGFQPGNIAAVVLPRGFRFLAAALGTLQAGGVFLPLDPTYPAGRIQDILVDSQAGFILADASFKSGPLPPNLRLLDVATAPEPPEPPPPLRPAGPETSGYILYTSGSTGRPKGIRHGLSGLANAAQDSSARFSLGPSDRVLQVSPLGFDVSLGDWAASLWSGCTLLFAPPAALRDPRELFALLVSSRASVLLSITPTLLSALLDAAGEEGLRASALRLAVMVGEPPTANLCRRFYRCAPPGARLYNRYGPSEATQASTLWLVPSAEDLAGPVPAGRPIPGVSIWLLDRFLNPVPFGSRGEICIAGPHVAQGYHNRGSSEQNRFVDNPHLPGTRLYLTGDHGRWNQAGELVVLGRADGLVKIRGNRVELGEIEALLEQFPGVQRAAALVLPAHDGGQERLAAALISLAPDHPAEGEIRDHLRRRLPEYMLPANFFWLDRFPHTPNGKLDRRLLQAELSRIDTRPVAAPPLIPDGVDAGAWQRLSAIWSEVLEIEPVPAVESFFDMGGHSMLVLHLLSRVEQEFGIRLSLPDFFDHPTLAGQSVRLASTLGSDSDLLAPVQAGVGGAPLYLVHTIMGVAGSYTRLLAHLSRDIAVVELQMPRMWQENPPASLNEMAAAYRKAICARQPTGPYRLCGWSFGGLLALEIAAQMSAAGSSVSPLIIIDTDVSRLPSYPRLLTWSQKPAYYYHKIAKLSAWVVSRYLRQNWRQNAVYLGDLARRVVRRVLRGTRIERKKYPAGIPVPLRTNMDINFNIQDTYKLTPYPGRVHLFCAADRKGILEPRYRGWMQVAKQVLLQEIPGNHDTIMAESNVAVLAQAVNHCLRET